MDEVLARDGVVLLRGALTADEVAEVERVFDHGWANPSPGAYRVYPETGATFAIDTFHSANWDAYVPAFRDTSLPDHVARLWDSDEVWFFYEQLFLKEGGSMRRTPWHQDSSYLPVAGQHVAVCWITLDSPAATNRSSSCAARTPARCSTRRPSTPRTTPSPSTRPSTCPGSPTSRPIAPATTS